MTHLEYINQNYPARNSKSEKEKFQEYIVDYAKNKNIEYTPYIHTSKDVVVENSNIDFIAKNIVSFIDNI